MERLGTPLSDTVRIEKTDTIWQTDTLKLVKFKTKDRWVTRRDTVYKDGEILTLNTEQVKYQDTIATQEDTVVVQSYVSGINPRLDSLKLAIKKRELHTTQITEITKTKPKTFWNRFNVGLQVGYGLGLKSKEFEPYVGIGVGIKL